ncbi:uncharacterized protein MAM_00335 [Metarhizium album ARSEF 1941]|uniref:Uncharacterized protein n=1 Tax=Metarhizium album (strain ARSEF 1941) TaxID=1081103 RepID=A0A0B2X4Q6_METAS|nr:uncharacterized protein MAM_00335 [Metarhizium album ARSEF 1941]KHO01334.1 hypothetical protein MAM_00335 [Metarhizium album ARSEF 1941]
MSPRDRDRDGKLPAARHGTRLLVVFLRCAGRAYLCQPLRAVANRHGRAVTCVAVSHASEAAARKRIDLLGGAWNDRAVYAAWGLGVANSWHPLNPTTRAQAWREKGWLGDKLAAAMQRDAGAPGDDGNDDDAGSTVMWGGQDHAGR